MVGYYDYLLAAIPVTGVVPIGASVVLGLPTMSGIVAGAVLSILLIGHGLFIRAPTDVGVAGGSQQQVTEQQHRQSTNVQTQYNSSASNGSPVAGD